MKFKHLQLLGKLDSHVVQFWNVNKLSHDQMEETEHPRDSGDTDTSLEEEEQAKKFLRSVCRAYYPSFTSAIEDTYYSYEVGTRHSGIAVFDT